MRNICIIFLLLSIINFKIYGQIEKIAVFHNLTAETGLHHSVTKDIVQDRFGFMWIASSEGLQRFDRVHFSYFGKTVNSDVLIFNSIEKLFMSLLWMTLWFKIILLFIFLFAVFGFFSLRIYYLKKQKDLLSLQVAEQTEELLTLNGNLEASNSKINAQNDELVKHRNYLDDLVIERTEDIIRTKEIVEASEERFKTHYNNSPIPAYIWQKNGDDFILNEYNTAADLATNGLTKNLIGKKLSYIYKDRQNVIEDIHTCYSSKGVIRKKMSYVKKSGIEIIMDVTYVFVSPNNIIVHTDEITEPEKIKNELKESEERYRLLVEKGPSVFWIRDKNGKTLYISDNINKIDGYKPDDIYVNESISWINRIHSDDIENVLDNFKEIFTKNKRFDVRYRIKSNKGQWKWLQDFGEKYINEKGQELAYGVFTDITGNKNAQQKVYHAMINAEERERSRIAKDLHDGVSPLMSAVKLYIQAWDDSKDAKFKKELKEKISGTINETISSINEISNNLSPHILQNFGLKSAIDSFIQKISELKSIQISHDYQIKERFDGNTEVALYRILTELVNNTVKYSKATKIDINIYFKDETIFLFYKDNGDGFDLDYVLKNWKGMGLLNIKNRVETLNGHLEVLSSLNQGISVNLSIPLYR